MKRVYTMLAVAVFLVASSLPVASQQQEIRPIPVVSHGSGNGGMLRGGFALSPQVNLHYTAYFSALSTAKTLEAERSAGGPWSLFFPGPRLEAGFSFNRRLGPERFNADDAEV